jgi:hypothetical protein
MIVRAEVAVAEGRSCTREFLQRAEREPGSEVDQGEMGAELHVVKSGLGLTCLLSMPQTRS